MSTFTENYNLIKPDEGDYYDVQDFNENMDAIDHQMASTETEIESVSDKIGNSSDTNTSVFGKLNQINGALGECASVIKSIQRVIYQIPTGKTSGSVAINTVDASKSFVIHERLADSNNYASNLTYTLNADNLAFQHTNFSSGTYIFGFWIIEFN